MHLRPSVALRGALACLLAAGCGGDQAGAPPAATDGGDVSGIVTPTTGDGGAADTQPRLDLPEADTATSGGGVEAPGCEKVDLLFVIDNSGSMADEQANLIASFPGFMAAIKQTLIASDYHIMAVSTDDGRGVLDGDCDFEECVCTPSPTCCVETCDSIFAETCNGLSCASLPIDACDLAYGAGRTADQLGASCELAEGRRYMRADQPNIDQAFQCVASVGIAGSGDERPIYAALSALAPELNAEGGCNAGFLRDDAILVLVLITDEEDDGTYGSPGDPPSWYEQVVAAKHGNPRSVVVLGLVGDGNRPGSPCPVMWDLEQDGAEPSPRLQEFVEMFDGGIVGSVCSPDYAPFLLDAVGVIDQACDVFEPIG